MPGNAAFKPILYGAGTNAAPTLFGMRKLSISGEATRKPHSPSAEVALTIFFSDWDEDGLMSKDVYLQLQVSLICLLLFLNGMTVLAQHPEWFQ